MKQRSLNFVAVFALLLMTLPLASCRLYVLSVEIPDFDANQIEGVSLFRLGTRTSGEDCYDVAGVVECYDYTGSIVFLDHFVGNRTDGVKPKEILTYYNTQSPETTSISTLVQRTSGTDAVRLRLQYIDLDIPDDAPVSTYRIKTFNAVGESPISAETIVF